MTAFKEKLQVYTESLNQSGLLRTRSTTSVSDPAFIRFDSNDYLSLTRHPAIGRAYQKGYELYPSGSGASVFLNGYHESHQTLERAFAQWLDVDDCVLFSSGYAANLAMTALMGALKSHCLIDKGVHASVYDGLKLAQVVYKRYLHNDLKSAAQGCSKEAVLITEGIFSMSGQISPLKDLAVLCAQHQMQCIVDEAHSIGFLGSQGRGAVTSHGLSQTEVPLRIIPLGKAFAGQGAVIAGEKNWIQALLQAGRSLTYSTAISPALCYGLLKTLDVVAAADERRCKLNQLIHHFRAGIHQSSLNWVDSTTPIQQVQLGCPHLALHYAQQLKKQGIGCSAIRQPTVNLKASGLRIVLNYHHQPEQLDQLFKHLACIRDPSSD